MRPHVFIACTIGFLVVYLSYDAIPKINLFDIEIAPVMLVFSIIFVIRCFDPLDAKYPVFAPLAILFVPVDIATGWVNGSLFINMFALMICDSLFFFAMAFGKLPKSLFQTVFLALSPPTYALLIMVPLDPGNWYGLVIVILSNVLVLLISIPLLKPFMSSEVEAA